ncbi:MAG: tRNA pseudouridine(38-40) synthase TruA [Brevinematales bacterium]|nr:tRNA pseudouridine(38-40) synthase TruA [Brevinematales bacterium]
MGTLHQECRNIKIVLSYDGSLYNGWQKQKNTPNTIQEILEKHISKILKENVKVIGSGRTDAKAHSLRQVANFKTSNFSIPADRFKPILNGLLPESIRIISSEEVNLNFNARYSAKFRKYIYLIFLGDEKLYPFLRNYAYIPNRKDYNIEFMSNIAKELVGKHDFSIISSKREYKTTTRFVKKIRIFKMKDFLVFSIVADGFMYNMARGIVSSIMEAERNNDPTYIPRLLEGKIKNKPSLIPANGLYLHRVYY